MIEVWSVGCVILVVRGESGGYRSYVFLVATIKPVRMNLLMARRADISSKCHLEGLPDR